MTRGFTLIQISLLVTLASLTLVACLPSLPSHQTLANGTTMRMNVILTALRKFESSNGRLPCPGDAAQPVGSNLYGVEAANGGAAGNCTGGSPAATLTDPASHVAIGMVPLRALGLPDNYALDDWGRTLTYAVDTGATSCFAGTLTGALTVTDNGAASSAVAALVSYGFDGHGAWIPQTGTALPASRLNANAGDADELTNAHVDGSFNPVLPLTQFVRKPPTRSFDDLVTYRNPQWSLASSPIAAASVFPTLTIPVNATYMPGQTLTFTLTYPGAVSVTGLPRLVLKIGSQARYASYVSGSGTTTLTFSYTLQNGDYAPSGVSINATVDLNSGSLSSPCNSFTQPSLAGVQVKNLYVYVSDAVNGRVEAFNSTGVFQAKFGSPGSGNGQFLTPNQPAADSSGNIWVSDWVNARAQEFTSGGTYESQFGSLGILNGQFTTAGSMAIDSAGNFWVADVGGNRIEKFDPRGAYVSQFGSLGVLAGQFTVPTGIAFDASGNIWVGDFGGNRLEKFSASGTYLSKFGSFGIGNGQFINPCGHAIDASGNIWVADNGNNRVQEFNSSGVYLSQFGTFGIGNGQFIGPCGVAIDLTGNIWVVDVGNNRVEEFSAAGTYLRQFGSAGTGNGQFLTPGGIGLAYY